MASCGSGSNGASAGPSGSTSVTTYSDLSSLEAAAKAEGGQLNLIVASEYTAFYTNGFKAAYPWAKLTVTQLEPAQAGAKWQAELGAGLHQTDIVGMHAAQLKPFTDENAVARVQVPNDSLVSSALRDPSGYVQPQNQLLKVILYNTKLVSQGPTDLQDLADPAWRGKIVLDDPSLAVSSGPVLAMERKIMGDDAWKQWLTKIKANKPLIVGGDSEAYAAVVQGEAAVCICSYADYLGQKPGTPVAVDFYNQQTTGSLVDPVIAVVAARAPHPKMAALFINWMLSPTGGQLAMAKSGREPAVPVPGSPATVPTSVKEASEFDLLSDYLSDPTTYIDTYKQIFG